MSTTLSDIETRVYYLMSQQSTSATYPSTTLVRPKINSVVGQICKGSYTSILDPKKTYTAADLRFLRTKTPINHYASIDIGANFAVGATEITCTLTNLAAAGDVIHKGNVIHYTGKNATQITGCTNVLVAGTTDDKLRRLEKISVNMSKPVRLTVWNDGGEQDMEYLDPLAPASKDIYYTIIGDDTAGSQFLDVIGVEDEYLMWLYGYSVSTDMTLPNSVCSIPGNYGLDVVAPIVAGELLRGKEQTVHASNILTIGYNALQDMYSGYVEQIKKNNTTIDRKKPSFSSLK